MLESYSMYERFWNFVILSFKTSTSPTKKTSLGYFTCFPPELWFLSRRTFSCLVFTSSQNVNWRKPLCPSHIRCYILSNWQNHILAYNGQQFWSTLALLCLKNSPEERNNYRECFCLLFKHEGMTVDKFRRFPSFSRGFFTEKSCFLTFAITSSNRKVFPLHFG